MSRKNLRKMFLAIALPVTALLAANVANAGGATASLRLTNGASTTTVFDNGVGDSSATLGVIEFNGSVGDFNVNVTTGLSYPFQGAIDSPELDLSSINVASGSIGTLVLELTTIGFIGPVPEADTTLFAGGTTNGTVTVDSYIDIGDVAFGTGTATGALGPFAPIDFDGTDSSFGVTTSSSYSATIVATIVHDDTTDLTSFGAQYRVVPEPTSLALLSIGGLLMARRRRARD